MKKAADQPSPFKTKDTFHHTLSHYNPSLSSTLLKGAIPFHFCSGGEHAY